MDKLLNTKYIFIQFLDWYKESFGESESNDLSILKSLKLIFLLSTINTNKQNESLLDFDFRYAAMPYGPVEKDIYDWFKEGKLDDVIDKQGIKNHNLFKTNFDSINCDFKKVVDTNIIVLKSENFYLITKSASYLVDLTHEFTSWKENYNKALSLGKYSEDIPKSDIQKDNFFYSF